MIALSNRHSIKALVIGLVRYGLLQPVQAQQGKIISTGSGQGSFTKAHKMALEASDEHYRSTGTLLDTLLFPAYGEHSIYWIGEGSDQGAFVYPNEIPQEYQYVQSEEYQNYNWEANLHYAIDFQ